MAKLFKSKKRTVADSGAGDVEIPFENKPFKQRFIAAFKRDFHLYLLCIPALFFIILFEYGAMYGLQVAFKDFSPVDGIWGSPWVGFEHFIRFFKSPNFWMLIKNTLGISVYSLIAGFPLPIIFALLVNQLRSEKFKKTFQMIVYAPHFISIVVLVGMITVFLNPSTGLVNNVLANLGLERIFFMAEESLFKHIFVWSDVWQNTGWGMIIYLAALSSIDPSLYEAARIDGASRLQIMFNIEIPGILPTVVILFIMRTGKFMNLGFQKAFLMQNPLNIAASEIIPTYVYKIGLMQAQFSYSTAIGLFNTVINIILLFVVNKISQKLSETSLW